MGRDLKGIYHLLEDRIYVYEAGERGRVGGNRVIEGLDSDAARELFGDDAERQAAEIELVRGATASFDPDAYRAGRQTPVLFGSAISNFGVEELLAGVRRQRGLRPYRARASSAACRLPSRNSPASCSRSRPIWIQGTATGSHFCACAPGATSAACASGTCGWTRSSGCRCADLHGR